MKIFLKAKQIYHDLRFRLRNNPSEISKYTGSARNQLKKVLHIQLVYEKTTLVTLLGVNVCNKVSYWVFKLFILFKTSGYQLCFENYVISNILFLREYPSSRYRRTPTGCSMGDQTSWPIRACDQNTLLRLSLWHFQIVLNCTVIKQKKKRLAEFTLLFKSSSISQGKFLLNLFYYFR